MVIQYEFQESETEEVSLKNSPPPANIIEAFWDGDELNEEDIVIRHLNRGEKNRRSIPESDRYYDSRAFLREEERSSRRRASDRLRQRSERRRRRRKSRERTVPDYRHICSWCCDSGCGRCIDGQNRIRKFFSSSPSYSSSSNLEDDVFAKSGSNQRGRQSELREPVVDTTTPHETPKTQNLLVVL